MGVQKDSRQREWAAEDWLTETDTFRHAHFRCFVDPTSMKVDGTGGLRVTLNIPAGQVTSALPLRLAIRERLPLTVTIDVAEEERALTDAQEAALEALRAEIG